MKNKQPTQPAPAQATPTTPVVSYYIARVPGGYYQLMRFVNGVSEKVGEPNLLAIVTHKLAQQATATHVSLF